MINYIPVSEVPPQLKELESISGSWIKDRVGLFDPFKYDKFEEHEVRLKAFSELSVYLLLAQQLRVDPLAISQNLRALIISRANNKSYYQALQRNPLNIRKYGYPLIFTKLSGQYCDSTAWDALGNILSSDFVWAKDRLPYAFLDIWHMAKLYGIEPLYDLKTILQTSSLTKEINPIWSELNDVYPLTHNIMFARGFGMKGFGFLTEPGPYNVRLSHVGLILRFLADRMYDPMMELLTTGVLQRQIPPDLVGICLNRLIMEAKANGYVPDRSIENDKVSTISQANAKILDHLGDRAVNWGTHYHVNLVTCFFTLCTRAEWPAFAEVYNNREPLTYDPENLLLIGEALSKLAEYDLKAGAEKLQMAANTNAAKAYPEVFETAVSFLANQRRDDGGFGYWPEERKIFGQIGYDSKLFEKNFAAPTTQICTQVLDNINGYDVIPPEYL